MKISRKGMPVVFLAVVFLVTGAGINAQEPQKMDKLNIKLGYSKYQNTEFFFGNYFKEYFINGYYYTKDGEIMVFGNYPRAGNLRISTNYNINKYVDAGLYFGYSLYKTFSHTFNNDSTVGTLHFDEANSITYGASSNLHILPFFIDKEKYRLDVYCSFQLGVVHLFEPEDYINTNVRYLEYGIYGGLAFYPFRHLGLYAEYGFAKYANLRYGLTYWF